MQPFAPRTRWIKLFLLLICSALIAAPIAHGAYVPQSATRLIADIDIRESAEPDRIPLILIHGFTGTDGATFEAITGESDSEKEYFKEFLEYFYTTDTLNDTYKLYRFHYLSNEVDVSTIGADLRIWIDEAITSGQMDDTELVLIGHSMGGLISRAYMEEQQHLVESFAGRKGGERVRKLITLGTPHHGSQAANDAARDAGEGWNTLLEIVDTIFWQDVGIADPNRSDLRWDNYNNMTGYGSEQNEWLFNLNGASAYSDKIIAYGGGVEDSTGGISDRYSLKLLWEQLENSTPNEFSGLFGICESTGRLPGKNNFLSPFKGPYDNDRPFTFQIKLCFAGVLLDKIYDMNNDGLVPADSANYRDGAPGDTRWFEGFDHWDLKSDRTGQPAELMLRLQEDLENIALNLSATPQGDYVGIAFGDASYGTLQRSAAPRMTNPSRVEVIRSEKPDAVLFTTLTAYSLLSTHTRWISSRESSGLTGLKLPAVTYADYDVIAGKTYFYRLKIFDETGNSIIAGLQEAGLRQPDLNDLITVLKTLAGVSVTADNLMIADQNGSERLDMGDALILLQILAGIR